MLLDCPECSHRVSDRAEACPSCGYPIREWLAEEQENAAARQAVESREEVGEVDCVPCLARGFINLDEKKHGQGGFTWCPLCEHTGRVVLCHATDGYYAVSRIQVEGFLAGELHADAPGISHLGEKQPEPHRYPQAGPRREYDELPAWFVELLPKLLPDE